MRQWGVLALLTAHCSICLNVLCLVALDPASRRLAWECFRRKRPGRVIVMVSQNMSEADICSDR